MSTSFQSGAKGLNSPYALPYLTPSLALPYILPYLALPYLTLSQLTLHLTLYIFPCLTLYLTLLHLTLTQLA